MSLDQLGTLCLVNQMLDDFGEWQWEVDPMLGGPSPGCRILQIVAKTILRLVAD
jgi:hypothetical protein